MSTVHTLDQVREDAVRVRDRLTGRLLVRMADSQLQSTVPERHPGVRMEGELSLIVIAPGPNVSSIGVEAGYRITATAPTEDGEPEQLWRADAAFHGEWKLAGDEAVSDQEARAFAAMIGLMALHPYARTEIQHLTVASGWPVFIMDALIDPLTFFECEDDESSYDLDEIQVRRAEAIQQ